MYLLTVKSYNDLIDICEKYKDLKIIPSAKCPKSFGESYKFKGFDTNLRGEFLVLKEKRGKLIAFYPKPNEYDYKLDDFVFYLKEKPNAD